MKKFLTNLSPPSSLHNQFTSESYTLGISSHKGVKHERKCWFTNCLGIGDHCRNCRHSLLCFSSGRRPGITSHHRSTSGSDCAYAVSISLLWMGNALSSLGIWLRFPRLPDPAVPVLHRPASLPLPLLGSTLRMGWSSSWTVGTRLGKRCPADV